MSGAQQRKGNAMNDVQYSKLMKAARITNRRMDSVDRKAGFAAPGDCDLTLQLRTAMSAIECGIKTGDWSAVAEGLDILQRAEEKLRSTTV